MTAPFQPDPDTWYVLTFAHSGLALSTKELSRDNGVRLCQQPYERLGNQQWRFVHVEGDWYAIRPRFGGKSVKVYKSQTGNRAPVHLWQQASDEVPLNEQWKLEPHDAGGYLVRARHSGKVLDLKGRLVRPGVEVQQWAAHGDGNQRLQISAIPAPGAFTPEPGAWYTLRFGHSGLVLDVEGWKDENGAKVWQYAEHGGVNQQWRFEEVEPGWYFIRPRHSARVLDVAGWSKDDGTRVQLWSKGGSNNHNQHWRVEPWGGGYRLRARNSGAFLAVRGGSLEPREVEQHRNGWQRTCVRIEHAVEAVPASLPPRALRADSFGSTLRLPPVRAFGPARETTLETWVRPRSSSSSGHETLIEVGERDSRFALERDDGKILVRLYRSDRTHTLCESESSVIEAGSWTHVCATVRHDNKDNRYDLELFIDGRRVDTGRTGKRSSDDGRKVFASGVQSEVAIASNYAGSREFGGELAELRLWSVRRSSEEIAADHCVRMRGDEHDTLSACYPFERVDEAGRIVDVSVNRLHITPSSAGESVDANDLPLPPITGEYARIEVEGELYGEYFDEDMLDDAALDTLGALASADPDASPSRMSLDELGTRSNGLIELNVFDTLLTPRNSEDSALPNQLLQLWLVRPQVVIRDNLDGSSRAEVWDAGRHTLRTGSDGSIALRFVAVSCEGPVLYARFGHMARGAWAPVLADTALYTRMHELSGAELRSPSSGRPSPLPAGTSQADADGLAEMFASLAWAGATRPSEGGTTSRGWFSSTKRWFDKLGDALEDTGEVVWKQTKPVGQLIDTAEELADEAVKQGARIGRRAVVRRIAGADAVNVVLEEVTGARPLVQIVGRTGSDYWRVLVTTIEEAAAAVWSVMKRVGADIQKFISMLAGLFDWAAFLAESDRIYDEARGAFADISQILSEIGSVRERVAPYLEPGPSSPNFDDSLNDWMATLGPQPKFRALDRVLRYAQRIFVSPKFNFDLGSPALALDFAGVDLDAVGRTISDAIPPMLSSPTSLFEDPARPLLELPASVWSEVADSIDPICNAMFGAVDTVTDAVEGLLTARIRIPLLTKVIEETILGLDGTSRKLNLLRLIALVAAIPTVLAGQGSGDSGTTEPSAQTTTRTVEASSDDSHESGARDNYRTTAMLSAGIGIINWVMWSVRAYMQGDDASEKAEERVALIQGVPLMLAGIVDAYRIPSVEAHRPAEVRWVQVSMVLNWLDAVCCVFHGMADGDVKDGADTVGSWVLGAGWIANSALFASTSTLVWDSVYWGLTWVLGGSGKWLQKREYRRSAIAAYAANTNVQILYLIRASVSA